MKTTILMDSAGHTANRFIDIGNPGSHLQRLLAGGIIRAATEQDRQRLASRNSVNYPGSGASWGSGSYVLETADELYVTANDFNLGHIELAVRRMHDQDRNAVQADLFNRLDGARCPTCGR